MALSFTPWTSTSMRQAHGTFQQQRYSKLQMAPIDVSSLVTSIEYFDGSQVVDPVVVSTTFSSAMQARFVSFIIGQALAAIVFGLVTSVASQQISKAGDWVSTNVFKNAVKPVEAKAGPRPSQSPAASNDSKFVMIQRPDLFRLLVCIGIDIIGTSSELIPVLGEVTDIAWAPIAAFILRNLYGGSNVVLVLEFAEEILPLTDILPLATICWVIDTFLPASDIAKLLQLGIYRSDYEFESQSEASSTQNVPPQRTDFIDIKSESEDQKQLRSAAIDSDGIRK